MKRFAILLTAAVCGITAMHAFDLKDILKGASQGNGSNGGNILGGVVTALTSRDVELKDITGTWNYVEPAISFDSDNVLKKAGGAAASGTIVAKLAPYYSKAGLNNLTFTVGADSTFTATTGKIKARGTISSLGDGQFQFKFKAFGKVPTGSLNAFITKSGQQISVTFDAQKLMKIVNTVANISGSATAGSLAGILNSYDGINIGATLKPAASAKQ